MTLRTNLATRPFYNVRAVHTTIAALAVVVLAMTLFNAVELVRLMAAQRTLGARAAAQERDAERLKADAARIRTQINQKELEAVSAAAREANGIIDRRAFSWTALLTQLEATLPDDMRITTVQPRLDQGVFKVGLIAEARRAEDVATFIEALENTGAFKDVVPLQQQGVDSGLIRIALEGIYEDQSRGGADE